jgi:hypothetical protein
VDECVVRTETQVMTLSAQKEHIELLRPQAYQYEIEEIVKCPLTQVIVGRK